MEQPPTVQVNHTTTENIEQSPAESQASQNDTSLISGTVQQPSIAGNDNVVSIRPQSKLPKLVLPTFHGKSHNGEHFGIVSIVQFIPLV